MQSVSTGSLRLVAMCRHCRRQLSTPVVDAATATATASKGGVDLADAVNALSRRRRGAVSSLTRRLLVALPDAAKSTRGGLFGVPELREGPAGFGRLQSQAQAAVAGLLAEALLPSGRGRPMVRILDDMSDSVCRVADMADCARQLHPSAEYRAAAEAACVAIATLVESLNTNRGLYEQLLRAVRDTGPSGDAARFATDDVDNRVGELLIWDFLQSGVHFAGSAAGQRFVALCERAFVLGAEFSRGAMQPARGATGGLLRDPAGEHPDPRVRRAAYAAFYAEMPQQESILLDLLRTRRDLAHLAGFRTFADRANAGCLLDTAESVGRFLSGLAERLAPRVAIDAEIMRRLSGGGGEPPGAGDFVHLVNAATAACFRGEQSVGRSIDEFFSVGACLRGVAHVAECLFGVRLEVAASDESAAGGGEVWDERVFKLRAWRRGDCGRDAELGWIYCDFFPRASKPAQDCHFTIRGGRQGPPRQQPVVCLQLQCPDPPAIAGAPSLLSPCHVENLFHEFGHALHSVLGCTRYQHVTGTRCSTDLAEVPSTLFEMFAFQPCVLAHYARHWRTGEPLPQRLYAPLRASRRVLPASSRQQQVLYSLLDMRLHCADAEVPSTTDAFRQLAGLPTMRHLPPYPPGTAWHHRFTHLVGYGAKYHAYLVSKSVASLVWSTRFARDPLCSAAGGDLERRLLARGGEASTVAMVTELTGRPATVESLADSLLADVVESQEWGGK